MDGITFYGRYFNVITMNTQSQKVSMAEKIGYSLGDCSANLVFQMMMIIRQSFIRTYSVWKVPLPVR